jgi:hypothetical protein
MSKRDEEALKLYLLWNGPEYRDPEVDSNWVDNKDRWRRLARKLKRKVKHEHIR